MTSLPNSVCVKDLACLTTYDKIPWPKLNKVTKINTQLIFPVCRTAAEFSSGKGGVLLCPSSCHHVFFLWLSFVPLHRGALGGKKLGTVISEFTLDFQMHVADILPPVFKPSIYIWLLAMKCHLLLWKPGTASCILEIKFKMGKNILALPARLS